MRLTILTILTMLLTACGDKDTASDDTNDTEDTGDIGVPCEEDKDSDLSCAEFDCNDEDASIRPGAIEIWYDGIDQNCDGNDRDQDGDGEPYSGEDSPDNILDCDDQNPNISHYDEENNTNGIDDDCDGQIDNRFYEFKWNGGDYVKATICDMKAQNVGFLYIDENADTTTWDGFTGRTLPVWDYDEETNCISSTTTLTPPVNGQRTIFVWMTSGKDEDTNFADMGAADDASCIVWGPQAQLVVDFYKDVYDDICTELPGQPVWSEELEDWVYLTTW